jgi:hypothetical protein
MALLHFWVRLSESKLVVRDPIVRILAFIDPLSISFSKTFEIMGNRLIGRYDETSVGFFPGLGIIIISAHFNDVGQ